MPFIIAYILTIGAAIATVASFMAVVHVRNRVITAMGESASIIANPLATAALHLRGWGAATILAIPGSAFAPGILRRLLYLATLILITLAELAISSERLAALYGLKPLELPIDVTWASAIAWLVASGFFASMSIELRHQEIGHPWDDLTSGARYILRWVSDVMLVLVALSGLVFWFWGALAAAGSYPLLPVLFFMSSLGIALTVAAGICFWAAHDSWATLWGVILIVAGITLRIIAYIPEIVVVTIRKATYAAIATLDIAFLGVARPLLLWWTGSRLGKALGHPPLEEPIDWPEIGVAELPLEPSADEDDDADGDESKLLRLPQFVRRLFHEERAA
ncbi:MAG: hypothetical protein IT300_16745 [Dehalococcoidia bacterium]|jgi:hypothetical protein|nr:hypothetical protein [Dehalococcoidia bacterium]